MGDFNYEITYAVGAESQVLYNKIIKFFGSISLKIYLAHMVIFRLVEKLGLLYIFGSEGVLGWISFGVTFVLVIAGLIVFIQCYKVMAHIMKEYWLKRGLSKEA